jgi:hypothetical protein
MGDRAQEYAERYENFLRETARHLAEISGFECERHVARPGAPWWARLKVKFKNWRAERAARTKTR